MDITTRTTARPDFANKIIQLAINRTGKSATKEELPSEESTNANRHPNSISSSSKPHLSSGEYDRGKQDIATVNSDLQLLSTLLGRPITADDLPQLTQQFQPKKAVTRPTTTTTTTTTTQRPSPSPRATVSKSELEQSKKDIANVDNDLRLLSTLLGRPITANDLPGLTQSLGGGQKQPVRPTTTTTTTQRPPPSPRATVSKSELDQGKKDIANVDNDLRLLSTLLGRPITANDLPGLTQSLGGGAQKQPVRPTTTTTTTTTTTRSPKPAIVREVELLQSLLNTAPKQPASGEFYGKTDEAILATLLKQQGIGPTHNNIPIEVGLDSRKTH